jgi:peroxiredoxin
MALVYTPENDLGHPCPTFALESVQGTKYTLSSFADQQLLLVMFICNHCPYVKAIEDRLITFANSMKGRSIAIVAIASNDADRYPDDSREALRERADLKAYPFPYLFDETQQVARDFGAVCTPDFFLYDGERKLKYRGRLDDSWKNPSLVKQTELKDAVELLFAGKPIPTQTPSMGCSIKWKNL